MPFSTAAFGIAGLSLIGVPLTAGFISKWYLVQASFESGDWWIAGLIVLSSLLAVIYVWSFIETAYLRPTPARNEPVKEVPASMAIPTWILVAATLFFGINAEMTSQAAITAANLLMAPQGSVVP